MKRRNFLSGLLAAPLALKARLSLLAGGFFAPKPCTPQLTPLQLQLAKILRLLANGKSVREIDEILCPGSTQRWAEKTAELSPRAFCTFAREFSPVDGQRLFIGSL